MPPPPAPHSSGTPTRGVTRSEANARERRRTAAPRPRAAGAPAARACAPAARPRAARAGVHALKRAMSRFGGDGGWSVTTPKKIAGKLPRIWGSIDCYFIREPHIWRGHAAPLYTSTLSRRHTSYTHHPSAAHWRPIPCWPYRLHGAPAPSALPPHPPTHTHPTLCPDICLCPSAERAKPNALRVGPGRTGKGDARQTRVGDRHAPMVGCGDLNRQLP